MSEKTTFDSFIFTGLILSETWLSKAGEDNVKQILWTQVREFFSRPPLDQQLIVRRVSNGIGGGYC